MAAAVKIGGRRCSEQYIGWVWASVILPFVLPFLWACFMFIVGTGFGGMEGREYSLFQRFGYILYTVIANGTFVFFGTDLLMNMQDTLIAGYVRSRRMKKRLSSESMGEHHLAVYAVLKMMKAQQGNRDKNQILPIHSIRRNKWERVIFYFSASVVYFLAVTLFSITLYASSGELKEMFPAPSLEESIKVFLDSPGCLIASHFLVTSIAVLLALHLAKVKDNHQVCSC